MKFDRKVFFDRVKPIFGGKLTQQQVDGMGFKLARWEESPVSDDLRHVAYCLATSKWETAQTCWPIEEHGRGAGKKYGTPDPETGETYYGRGDVQLTWKENYQRATEELGLTGDDDLVWNPSRALDPTISAAVMYLGMSEGWFRKGQTLGKYFNLDRDDSFGAREIVNGDKNVTRQGRKIGAIIADYHAGFLDALRKSFVDEEPAEPPPAPVPAPIPSARVIRVTIELELRVASPLPVDVVVTRVTNSEVPP